MVREAPEFFLVLSIIPSHQTAYLLSRAGKSSHAISLTNCGTMDKTLISNRSFFGRVFPLGTQPKSSIFLPTRSEFSITLSSHCNLLTQPNGIYGTTSSLLLAKEGMLLGKEGRSNSSITEIEIPWSLYILGRTEIVLSNGLICRSS